MPRPWGQKQIGLVTTRPVERNEVKSGKAWSWGWRGRAGDRPCCLCRGQDPECIQRVTGGQCSRQGFHGLSGYKFCFWVETGWQGSKMESGRPQRERMALGPGQQQLGW